MIRTVAFPKKGLNNTIQIVIPAAFNSRRLVKRESSVFDLNGLKSLESVSKSRISIFLLVIPAQAGIYGR